jgi:hypothetical protein
MPYFGHPGSTSARIPKMTQVEFIAILFVDCHYDTAAQRRDRAGQQHPATDSHDGLRERAGHPADRRTARTV